jgi:hypothetical protein
MTSVYMGAPLRPQLDHSDPSYQAALDRCYRAAPGESAHPDGDIPSAVLMAAPSIREPILPDPPGAQRRAQSARPRGMGHKAAPNRQEAIRLLSEYGRPATAAELAPGNRVVAKALSNARAAGIIKARQIIRPGVVGGWCTMYALLKMEWPDLPAPARYWDGLNRKKAGTLSKTQAQKLAAHRPAHEHQIS